MNTDHGASSCLLCSSSRLEYEFVIEGYPLYHCRDCNLMFLAGAPLPAGDAAGQSYDAVQSDSDGDEHEELLYDTAWRHLDLIRNYSGMTQGKLLEIDCESASLLKAASERGYVANGLTECRQKADEINTLLGRAAVRTGNLELLYAETELYDFCIIRNGIQKRQNPVAFLQKVRSVLNKDGVLFFTFPSLDSRAAKVMRERWVRFRKENIVYFDSQTVQTALFKAGFGEIHVEPERKYETLSHIRNQVRESKLPAFLRILFYLRKFVPGFIDRMKFRVSLSSVSVLCRPAERRERPMISVVMPVFNEKNTFGLVMETLVGKKIENIDKEIIIVESNSTDGTREEVKKYEKYPGVKIIFEDRPRGKGYAVRTGLQNISGDFVLIQDGDLEYDINDYDVLIEPLLAGRTGFVLGTRHLKDWKIRQFEESFLADFLNFGHRFLVILMNLMYHQSMTDPFTMYKVFRRDCMFGLAFECDRFNFDIELVCKLLRKGYTPLEVPINYRSRSFSEGKKVKIFRDPPTWIKAIFKYRFEKVYNPFRNDIDRDSSDAN